MDTLQDYRQNEGEQGIKMRGPVGERASKETRAGLNKLNV